MKPKLTIYLCVALLPSIIHGTKSVADYVKEVAAIAEAGGRIEGIFQPTGGMALGKHSDRSFVFPGTLYANELSSHGKEIAMKFTRPPSRDKADREYAMYWYLKAIDKKKVERYGIPTVYYYGTWHRTAFTMLAISLLDKDISDEKMLKQILEHDVNILIILRDFILTSKYMHSRGVRHDYIEPSHIVIRNHRSFLVGFDSSFQIKRKNTCLSMNFASRRAHSSDEIRHPIDDWESFLYTICYTLGVRFEWMKDGCTENKVWLKSRTDDTIKTIRTIGSKTLSKILVEFARHVFDGGVEGGSSSTTSKSQEVPDYNRFFELVNAKIDDEIKKSKLPQPAMFTWLTEDQKEEAAEDQYPDITNIKNPINVDFSKMKYEDVEYDKFILF